MTRFFSNDRFGFNTTQTNPIAIRPEEATTHTVSFGRIVITFPRKFISISAEIH